MSLLSAATEIVLAKMWFWAYLTLLDVIRRDQADVQVSLVSKWIFGKQTPRSQDLTEAG